MNKSLFKIRCCRGFTLIELMIVVSVIGILSGITISLISQGKQKARAEDSVNLANLEKTISAIESYFYSEGNYPVIIADNGGNPLLNGSNTVLKQYYVQSWPVGFMYVYDPATSSDFAVYVKRKSNDNYYKYYSGGNEIHECSGETQNITTDVTACVVVE